MSIGSLGIRTHAVGLAPSIEAIARSVNRRGIVVRVRASDFTQPLGKMSASASEFTKSLEASNARVLAFGASAAIIGGVTASFAQLVIQAAKVEKILADINAVLGTTAGNLQKFGDGLFNVARNTSQSLEVAAEAALEFSRQGLSMEETLKRTNDALILTRLTGLKAAESVKGLTAAVNGFADVGLTTTEIINKLAAVDVKFAVSADDLVNALARAGAVAQDAGVNFDQLIGAVTAAQQITARGGAVIGNSFKTIFTRIQRSSTLDRLEELGIAVRDIKGNTLPALTVLQNLSSSYDDLAVSTKAAVAEQVGGVFQINVLKAALKDLSKETSIYSQATMTSSQASNEAYQKNAMLQKTLSSIANQTLTTVRELTANLGELTIAPALKEFLESANNILGFISDMLGAKEGESLGADFAQGIARGLGNVIAGPGMVALVLIFGKLFSSALKFAKNSVKDLLQIKTIKDQELGIQESIVNAMLRNVELSEQLVKLDGNQVKQEELVLAVLRQQTKEIEQQRQIAQNIAPTLRRAGVQPNLIVTGNKSQKTQNSASGFIPNYSKQPTPIEEMKEKAGAKEGGYVAGKVSTMSIPKLGRVVYNDNETVKRFKGMDQPAIMPPKSSKAGKQYEKEFAGKHGFDPYASYGLIPNFALKATKLPGTNILNLPRAKMITETTQSNFKGQPIKGWRTLEAPLDNIAKSAMTYKSEFEALKKLGINVLRRKMYFSSQKSYINKNEMRGISRDQKTLAKSKGFAGKNQHKITGNKFESSLFKNSLQKKGYYPTWTGAYTPKGRQKGKGDENFKVDFFAPGRKPIESKYGKYTAPNLIAKSIRLYSDKYIEDFLAKQGQSSLAKGMQDKKLQDSSKMLGSLGYNDVGPKEVLRAGLSGGLIPNFVAARLALTGGLVGKNKFGNIDRRQMTRLVRSNPYFNNLMNQYLTWDSFPKKDKRKLSRWLLKQGVSNRALQAYGLTSMHSKSIGEGISNIAMAGGYIPNFASQNWQNEKSSGTVDNSVREMVEDKKKIEDKSGSKNHSHYNRGLIPNFNEKFKKTQQNKIDARYAYHIVDGTGRVVKPNPGQKSSQSIIVGKTAKLEENGKTIDFKTMSAASKIDTKKIGQIAGQGIAISFNTKPGNAYEKAIADTYVTKGWSGTGPSRLDFGQEGPTEWATTNMPKQNKLATPIGLDSKSLKKHWLYADAHFGGGHGPRPILEKLIAKGLVTKDDIQNAMNTGFLDLTKIIPGFSEIIGGGGENLEYTSNKIFKPLQSNQGVNKETFGNFEGAFKEPSGFNDSNPDGAFAIKFPKDHFTAVNRPKKSGPIPKLKSSGHIPNFANPLGDAISREKEALRERGSAADIYIDQDNRLKNPKNPAGLLVANTRDEPKSGSQGVNRAISMGMDPKTHGASGGIVPNFMKTVTPTKFGDRLNSLPGIKNSNKPAKEIEDAGKAMKETGDASGDLMMRIMGLTTVTYALQGAMGEASEEASNFQKGMSVANGAIMGLSQAAMIGMIASPKGMISKGHSAAFAPKGAEGATKGTRAMGAMKMLGGSLLGVGVAAAALIPIYQALKKNTELLDSPLDTLRKSAEKTSKNIDALGNAISSHQEIESTRTKMLELSNSAEAQTFDGEMKRLKLLGNLRKSQTNLANQSSDLAKNLGLSGEEITKMTSGTSEGMKALQEAQVLYARKLNAIQITKNLTGATRRYSDGKERSFSNIVYDLVNVAPMFSESSARSGRRLAEDIGFSEKTNLSGRRDETEVAIGRVSAARSLSVTQKGADAAAAILDIGSVKDSQEYIDSLEANVLKALKGGDKDQQGAAQDIKILLDNLKNFESESNRKDSIADLRVIRNLIQEYGKAVEDSTKSYTIGQSILRQIAEERANILANLRIEAIQTENNLNLLKMEQDNMMASDNLRNKIKDSLGIMSSAATVQAQLAVKSKDIDNRYNNDLQSINNEDIQARRKILQEFVEKGSKGRKVFQNLNQKAVIDNISTAKPSAPDQSDAEDLTTPRVFNNKTNRFEIPQIPRQFNNKTNRFEIPSEKDAAEHDPQTILEAGSTEAFDQNLRQTRAALEKKANETQDKIVKASLKKLAKELEGVRSSDEANNKMLEVLAAEEKIVKLKENLEALQSDEIGIIHGSVNLSELGLEIHRRITEEKKRKAQAEKDLREKNLSTIEKELNLSAGGLAAAKQRVEAFQDIVNPAELLSEKLHEELDATIETAGMTKQISDATFATLDSQEYRQKATKAMATTLTEELTQEYKSLVTQGARIEAEAELRKNTELYAKLIAQKVKNERGTISNQITDRATTTQANLRRDESGRNTFDYRTEDEVSKLTDSTINLRAQYEANKAANFYALEATEQLSQSQIKFSEEMDRLRKKIKAKGFFQEGLNAVERGGLTATANVQTAAGKVAGYADTGNTIRGAEAAVELARARKENNISNNSGDGNTLFSDTIAVRIAEANVEFERFNEVLANTTFDSVKQGLKDMVQMMGDSTKDMGDMFGQFFAGIAKAISDKLLDRATAQITTGIFELLGLNKGGIVGYNSGGYAGGGKTNQAPAMLTSGEYVVRKKVVDKLGPSTLDKINKTGSLSALYDEPNNDSFDMSTSDAGRMPPMLHMSEGGWLSKQWGKVKNFASESLSSNGDDSSWTKIAKGTGTAFGAGYANYEDRDTSNDPEPPQAPSTARLNTASDLNIDPSSNMMSSPARQGGDSYAKQYGDYLLKKYDFDVQQQNQKVQDRAQMWSGITNSLTMAVGSAGLNQMIKGVKGMYETRGGTEKTVERWKEQGINNLGDLRDKKPDAFAAYQNSINKANKRAGVDRVTAEQLIQSDASPVAPSCAGGQCSVDGFGGSGGTNIMENMMSQGASNPNFDKRNTLLNNYEEFSSGGKVRGPAGIDKVGPVMLDRGEYVIKASSVNNIEKQYPGFFDQLNAMRFNQGGIVGGDQSGGGSASPSSGNVTVNISVSSSGESSTSGGEAGDQAMAAKIKDAVVGVMSQEKRMGGMLRG